MNKKLKNSKTWDRTRDLRVMSPTHFLCAISLLNFKPHKKQIYKRHIENFILKNH